MDKTFDLAFIDTETTGLDPVQDEILELAVIRLSSKTLVEVARYHRYFFPTKPVPEHVAKINGYSEVVWMQRGARVMTTADLDDLDPVLQGAAFVGQNPGFDRGFVLAAYAKHREKVQPGVLVDCIMPRRPPPMDYHLIDVASLAWPLAVAGFIPGLSLRHTRTFFGLTGEQTHTALGDIEDTIHVYRKLMECYMTALFVDGMARQ